MATIAHFKATIHLSPVDGQGRIWRVDKALVFYSAVLGRTLTVPKDFICDLNSMPRLAWIVSPKTDFPAAGALHDWGYRNGHLLQADADKLYREALIVLGLSEGRAQVRYLALRTFGRFNYPGKAPVIKEAR